MELLAFGYISCVHIDIYIILKWCRYILLNCNLSDVYAFVQGTSMHYNGLGYIFFSSKRS